MKFNGPYEQIHLPFHINTVSILAHRICYTNKMYLNDL